MRRLALAAVAVVPLMSAARVPHAGSVTPLASRRSIAATVWDSVYSTNQASRGETAYVKFCARCHQASLGGADQSPPLAGAAFLGNWNGLTLADLHERIRTTMPSDSIGIVDRQVVTDVVAFMLKANGFPAGASDLASDADRLKAIAIQTSRP
jgi:mono/diheme cytochrome c family protein